MTELCRWSARVAAILILSQGVLAPDVAAEPAGNAGAGLSTREVVGYSVIGAGGFLTWIGVFAGSAGGKSPCSEESDEQKRDDCWQRERQASKRYEKIRLGVIGTGLVGIGAGLWLVKTSGSDASGAALRFDGRSTRVVATTQF